MAPVTTFLPRHAVRQPGFVPGCLDDCALVARAGRGDAQAFGELYKRHVDAVYLYVKLRVGDPEVSEELTQDIFFNAYRALPRFRWEGLFRPWLLRCAHNRIASHWRAVKRSPIAAELPEEEQRLILDGLVDPAEPYHEVEQQMDLAVVLRALEDLTDLQRHVLALRLGGELSIAETAAQLGRTQSSIKNLQYSALLAIRQSARRGENKA